MEVNKDIQRIISLSFEKIALERIQRGGVKLHRGLMLANVIYNAKHLAMNRSKSFISELSNSPNTDSHSSILETNQKKYQLKTAPSLPNIALVPQSIEVQKETNIYKRKSSLQDECTIKSKKSKSQTDDSSLLTSSCSLLNSFQMCHLNSPSKVNFTENTVECEQPRQYTTLNTAQLYEEEDRIEGSLYQAEEDLSSCSTQIREALDMLSRPVISLAV